MHLYALKKSIFKNLDGRVVIFFWNLPAAAAAASLV
jgi:hypothetical protein